MLKALTCFIVVAAVAIDAQHINSGSSNSGVNLQSTGSNVVQNDIQNVNDGVGWGSYYAGHPGYAGYLGYPDYAGYAYHPGYAGHFYHPGYYGYDASFAYGHGYAPLAGYAGIVPYYGYAGLGGQINSASRNTGANIQSTDSNVFQSHAQNVNHY